jgi:hypothetical protein
MYRQPRKPDGFRYCCGHYQQSHGAECAHNTVDGPTATWLLLACVRQRLLAPRLRAAVRRKLEALVLRRAGDGGPERRAREAAERELDAVRGDRQRAEANLARAKTDEQYAAVSAEFERLLARERDLEGQVRASARAAAADADPGAVVDAAMAVLDRMIESAAGAADLAAAEELFRRVDARLFLRFAPAAWGKRAVNKVAGGVVTFGATPPPVPLYAGPTGRRALQGHDQKQGGATGSAPP